jgi:hypothetical protein
MRFQSVVLPRSGRQNSAPGPGGAPTHIWVGAAAPMVATTIGAIMIKIIMNGGGRGGNPGANECERVSERFQFSSVQFSSVGATRVTPPVAARRPMDVGRHPLTPASKRQEPMVIGASKRQEPMGFSVHTGAEAPRTYGASATEISSPLAPKLKIS